MPNNIFLVKTIQFSSRLLFRMKTLLILLDQVTKLETMEVDVIYVLRISPALILRFI